RDIGFDLPTAPLPKFTGIKYHRITSRHGAKELYDPAAAAAVADAHASHFLEVRRQQVNELRALDFDPIVVAPFDAELFGHWWFEGPRFLESFIRKAAFDKKDYRLTTPSEYLETDPTQRTIEPAASSWGDKGHLEVWIDKNNSWIYPHLHAAAARMSKLAQDCSVGGQPLRLPEKKSPGIAPTLQDRSLKQLARELLLAQSSDWAFLMRTGTAREYATKRTIDHLTRFNQLHDQLAAGQLDEKFLADCEWRDNLFPNI